MLFLDKISRFVNICFKQAFFKLLYSLPDVAMHSVRIWEMDEKSLTLVLQKNYFFVLFVCFVLILIFDFVLLFEKNIYIKNLKTNS